VSILPLLMCKDNFVVEPSLWLEYATNEVDLTFDTTSHFKVSGLYFLAKSNPQHVGTCMTWGWTDPK
jgi:hypothetical protein